MTGFDPAAFADRERLRNELGYREGDQVCILGGPGVGADLLRRVIAAFPAARELVPALRMIVVAGPRMIPAHFPSTTGSRYARTCTSCTGIWPRATSPSSRAASQPRWS